MNKREETERQETNFFEEIPDEMGYTLENDRPSRSGTSTGDGISPRFVMAGCVGAVILIALIAFVFAGGSEVSKSDLKMLKSGLDRIEIRLAELEGMEKRVDGLEKEVKKLRASVGNAISRDVKTQKARPAASEKKTYYTVRSGDSLYTIARKHGLTVDRLTQINNLNPKKPIQPGQRLLVTP